MEQQIGKIFYFAKMFAVSSNLLKIGFLDRACTLIKQFNLKNLRNCLEKTPPLLCGIMLKIQTKIALNVTHKDI